MLTEHVIIPQNTHRGIEDMCILLSEQKMINVGGLAACLRICDGE